MAKKTAPRKKTSVYQGFKLSRQFIICIGLLLGLGILFVSLYAASQNTEDRSKAAESRKVYASWEFNTPNTNEEWKTDPATPTLVSGGHLYFKLASTQSRVQVRNSSLQGSIPAGQKYVTMRLAIGNFDQNVLGITSATQYGNAAGFVTFSTSRSSTNTGRFCAPRPRCLDNGTCKLLERMPGWCNPTPTVVRRPTVTPPAGCYYKQVQCFKAPCDPILVCPTGTDCFPRPSCLDANPPCSINLPPGKKYCLTTPTPKPSCRPVPSCVYENPPCSLVQGYPENGVTWCPPTPPVKLSMVVRYQVGTKEMIQSMPPVDVIADGQYHEYRVQLGQLQDMDIRSLGLEFPKVPNKQSFAFDWIRIEGIPIPVTSSPSTYCKTGLNSFAVDTKCPGNSTNGSVAFTSAVYECYDGTKGKVSVDTCTTSQKLADMAKQKCDGHSSCVKPTPKTYYCDNGQGCPSEYRCVTPGPCPAGTNGEPSTCAFRPYCAPSSRIDPTVKPTCIPVPPCVYGIKDEHGREIRCSLPMDSRYCGISSYPTRKFGNDRACIQVITYARNKATGECRKFGTPCDIPEGWVEDRDCTATTY